MSDVRSTADDADMESGSGNAEEVEGVRDDPEAGATTATGHGSRLEEAAAGESEDQARTVGRRQ